MIHEFTPIRSNENQSWKKGHVGTQMSSFLTHISRNIVLLVIMWIKAMKFWTTEDGIRFWSPAYRYSQISVLRIDLSKLMNSISPEHFLQQLTAT